MNGRTVEGENGHMNRGAGPGHERANGTGRRTGERTPKQWGRDGRTDERDGT